MKKSAGEIAELFWAYRAQDHDTKLRMRQVADIADGTVVIPLPELNAIEKSAVINQTHIGVQGYGQRFASVQPDVDFLPAKLTKGAEGRAKLRERAVRWWWQKDKMPLLDAQAGRYMFGYGTAPARIDMLFDAAGNGVRPYVSLPSPLHVYAPRPTQANDMRPVHGIAARMMDVATILAKWGEQNQQIRLLFGKKLVAKQGGVMHWVLEYADAEQTSIIVMGEGEHSHVSAWSEPHLNAEAIEVSYYPNRAMECPWVVPGLVHLNKPQGHFDQLVGMYQAQGLLTALELQQAARSVFQETWVVARPGEMPNIITEADPIRGVVGEISGGDIRTIAPDAQFHTHQTQDRLSEAQRATASLPADFGGQAASNVRTGARASQLIDAAVDPSLAEAQTTYALAKEEQVAVAAAYDRAYSRGSKTFALKWAGRTGTYSYDAEDLWDGEVECLVTYPAAGSDVNSLAILVGQSLGMNLISADTARKMMPFVADPDGEHDKLVGEKLESVFLETLAGMIADPNSPLQPRQLADLIMRVRDKDEDLVSAFLAVQQAAQEEQAQMVEPGTPEAMPGLDGAGAIPPAVAGPQQGSQNLASLLGALRMPERQVGLSSGGRA